MTGLKRKAARTAQRVGILTIGTLLCVVGVGFLTVAAWITLSLMVSVQMTALIIGAAYSGVGLLLIGITISSETPKQNGPTYSAAEQTDAPPIVQAFLHGLQAGAKAGQRYPH